MENSGMADDTMMDLRKRLKTLEQRLEQMAKNQYVMIFFLRYSDTLAKAGIRGLEDLKRSGEAEATAREKQYEAMGGAAQAGFSFELFDLAGKLASARFEVMDPEYWM